MKAIALDYGKKRIGVAVGDMESRVATPLTTLDANDDIARFLRDEQAEVVVVGMPLTMRGERGPQAVRVLAFVTHLKKELNVPIETVDERFSSQLADRVRDVYGKKVSRDALAAAAILETYFDCQKS